MRESEQKALSCTRAVVANSAATARALAADYGVPSARITIAPPGTDRVAIAPRGQSAKANLLTVGAVVPRKGYDLLIAALAQLLDLPWHLTIVGDCSRDAATAAQLRADIARYGLSPRVTIEDAAPAERLAALYAASDLFVLPSRYEGFGMAYAEAIAHGLPVIGTTAGAIPETVPAAAGVLIPPDDIPALVATLRRLLAKPGRTRPPRRRRAGRRRATADLARLGRTFLEGN